MGELPNSDREKICARRIEFEDNLPPKQEMWDPSPDGRQLYEPKMSAHICFMLRSYLELYLESYRNNQKYKKSEAWCCLGFRP